MGGLKDNYSKVGRGSKKIVAALRFRDNCIRLFSNICDDKYRVDVISRILESKLTVGDIGKVCYSVLGINVTEENIITPLTSAKISRIGKKK